MYKCVRIFPLSFFLKMLFAIPVSSFFLRTMSGSEMKCRLQVSGNKWKTPPALTASLQCILEVPCTLFCSQCASIAFTYGVIRKETVCLAWETRQLMTALLPAVM